MESVAAGTGGINGFTLKCIAMAAMLLDHIGAILFPQYRLLRILGRLAYPIYCFLLVEGAVHTSDWKKYLGRLFLAALASEIPFNLAFGGSLFYPEAQNVMFTLLLGLAAVLLLRQLPSKPVGLLFALGLVLLAEYMRVDYGGGGIVFVLLFFVFRTRLLAKSAAFAVSTVVLYGGIETYAILSMVPVLCYNGKRGPDLKYLFYLFYPVHLLILHEISLIM